MTLTPASAVVGMGLKAETARVATRATEMADIAPATAVSIAAETAGLADLAHKGMATPRHANNDRKERGSRSVTATITAVIVGDPVPKAVSRRLPRAATSRDNFYSFR